MNIFSDYIIKIKNIVLDLIEDNKWELDNLDLMEKIVLEPPKNKIFGDISSNAAMILASKLRKDPIKIADLISAKLNDFDEIKEANSIKPGFINIRFKNIFWQNFLHDLVLVNKKWLLNNFGKNKRINVEFVSANPTGPPHAGHARGAVFGDVLCAILNEVGFKVTREYYINDAGKQIEILIKSVFFRYLEMIEEKKPTIPTNFYPGEYLKPIALKLKTIYGNDLKFLSFEEYFLKIKDLVLENILEIIKNDLKKLGIKMDVFSSEQKIINGGNLEKVLKILKKKNLLYKGILEKPKSMSNEDWEPRKQLLFKSKKFGDDSDRALKKSDNTWTYFASDMAYHLDKINRSEGGELINILGADHGGYTSRLTSAVKAISENNIKLTNKICSIVHLSENNESIKMSKRSGNFVSLSEIVNKVGKDVVRFIMLTRRNDQTLDFDYQKVQEQSKDNPVFYVHYAYARCNSILKLADFSFSNFNLKKLNLLKTEEEINLIKLIAQWPRVIESAAKLLEPHRICFYLIELSSEFHSLWNKGKENHKLKFLVEDDNLLFQSRLILVKGIEMTIKSGLNILSIKPMRKM